MSALFSGLLQEDSCERSETGNDKQSPGLTNLQVSGLSIQLVPRGGSSERSER